MAGTADDNGDGGPGAEHKGEAEEERAVEEATLDPVSPGVTEGEVEGISQQEGRKGMLWELVK